MKPRPCEFCKMIVSNKNKKRITSLEFGGIRGCKSKAWCNIVCWKLYNKKENKKLGKLKFEYDKEKIIKAI